LYPKNEDNVTVSGCMRWVRCIEMCPEKDALKLKFAGKTIYKSTNGLKPKKD
jgi:hypothetical protein